MGSPADQPLPDHRQGRVRHHLLPGRQHPSVSFGSGADGVASPVGQGGEDPIKLSGSSVAYAGFNVKTTEGEGGKQFEHVIIATTEEDPDPAQVELPDAPTVDEPIVTNWSTKRDETIPRVI